MLQTMLTEIGLSSSDLIIMMIAAFLTAVFHSASGMAGALLLVIVLAPILGIKTVVPVVSVAVIISNSMRLWVFRHELDTSIYFPLILTGLPAIALGALIFVYLPVDTIAILLGLFMLVSVPGRRIAQNRGITLGRKGFLIIGPIYGLLSGVMMGTGLMMAPFYLGAGLVKGQIVAITAALGLTLNITKTVVFGASTLLTLPLFGIGVVIGLFTIPGVYVGRWILRRTSIRVHTLLIEVIILAGAIFFFSQAFTN